MGESKGWALVTGASSGIGAVYAARLAAQGHDLVLVARRLDRLEQLARELEAKHRVRVEALAADLASDAGLRRVEERITAANGLALLVNNAGFGIRGLFHETDRDRQEEMHRLHVIATVRLTHAALPGMLARRAGAIVNVSSVAAFAPSPWNTSYGATKTWMNIFSEAVAGEIKSCGAPIRVQALCPGYTYTEFHDVMGVDRKLVPDFWWMSSEAVVEASLRGLERNQLIVVPGWHYRLLVLFLTAMPRSLLRGLSATFARRMRKKMAKAGN